MWIEELAGLLVAGSAGTIATDIFATSRSAIPIGDGPFITIIETGGIEPMRTHNSITLPAYQRPTAQIVARARDYDTARAKARLAYYALQGIRNRYVDGALQAITSITRVGAVATVTTTLAHGFQTGMRVKISGATLADYNVAAFVTVTGLTTFTYPVANNPVTPAAGAAKMVQSSPWYQQISVRQEPFDMQVDSSSRARCGFNVEGLKQAS